MIAWIHNLTLGVQTSFASFAIFATEEASTNLSDTTFFGWTPSPFLHGFLMATVPAIIPLIVDFVLILSLQSKNSTVVQNLVKNPLGIFVLYAHPTLLALFVYALEIAFGLSAAFTVMWILWFFVFMGSSTLRRLFTSPMTADGTRRSTNRKDEHNSARR